MKDILQQMAAYNFWANTQITNTLLQCSDEEWRKPLGGSFENLLQTLIHMWQAESIWWQRMKLADTIVRPGESPDITPAEVVAGLLKQSQTWNDWVQQASEPALVHEFKYYNTKREPFKNPVYQMLIHVFNHATYHRGQLIQGLRQLGKPRVPSTDFILFTRRK
jgi:uncharacterized damage-inducible protein DinB